MGRDTLLYYTALSVRVVSAALLLAVVAGCRGGSPADRDEDRQAKELLHGVWCDSESATLVFKMEGDSVYYPDSTSMPAYFKVVGDTLYIGSAAHYAIERHTEHLLWFRDVDGELVKLVKSDDVAVDSVFERSVPKILTLAEVLKRDTVVYHDGQRYHLYVAINPTKYKVVHQTINDDGMAVENVYYDNIIHLSIFHGDRQLFSRDFRKQQYGEHVPAPFLQQAVLNDMTVDGADSEGLHVSVSLCVPYDASCYLIDHTVGYDGQLTTRLKDN